MSQSEVFAYLSARRGVWCRVNDIALVGGLNACAVRRACAVLSRRCGVIECRYRVDVKGNPFEYRVPVLGRKVKVRRVVGNRELKKRVRGRPRC